MKKKIYIEILRILAIFFVIFNHTSGFYLYANQVLGSPQFWVYTLISVFAKVAVPVFMLISGGLLLGKDEKLIDVWRKRILKIFLSFIAISVFYYIHNRIVYNTPLNFWDFIQKIYAGNINGHLWYLYLFLGYLISVPLLRKLVQSMEAKHLVYLMIVAVVFLYAIPTLEYLVFDNKYALNSNIKVLWVAGNIVLYPCMGYFIENKIDNRIKKFIPLMWLVNIICLGLTCYMTYRTISENGTEAMQRYINYFVVVNAMTIYISAKCLFENIKFNDVISKILCSVGSCTYGIYLLHIVVKDRPFMKDFTNLMIESGWNYMITYFVFTLVVLLFTYVIVWILRKIPGIRWLL